MSRRDDGLEISDSPPDPRTMVPVERDVLTGKPVRLDHRDKQRDRDQQHDPHHARSRRHPDRPAKTDAGRPVAVGSKFRILAAAGTAAAVVVIAGGVFLLTRPSSDAADPSPAAAAAPPRATVATSLSSDRLATSVRTEVATTVPAAVLISPSGVVPSPRGAISSPHTAASSASGATSSKPTKISPAGADPAGFNGTYRATYKVVAGTGTAEPDIGKTVTATLKVRTTCTDSSTCSTVIAINGKPQAAVSPVNGTWTDRYEKDDTCHDYYTGEATGGSYHFRVVTTYRAGATSGSRISTLTGTERLVQLTKCPAQPNAILTRTLAFTLTRTGP